ncbi:RNA-binding protein 7 [Eucyclogobius newberryi]|uniref:RNA-binding protein 7 n=1 Tax=Eucyclogobius newberryi TaxID=166745 RepID=UPI003B597218
MGIEEEADRTLFIRNLDSRVTEELLFELFLQAGPLVRTKIPKDPDGKQKTFGFAVYKHEASVPYAMQLLNGSMLFGKSIHVQFRSGSSHNKSPGNSQNSSPANTPNPHGARSPVHFNSPQYTPPQMQRPFFSPDNSLQKQVMMNNMMWSLHTQQMQQLEQSTPSKSLSRHGGGSRQHDNTPYRQSSGSRGRYQDESGAGHHQQYSNNWDNHHQNDWSRHHDNKGMKRHHDDRGNNRSHQDARWRRF